jgi:ribonuclease Z
MSTTMRTSFIFALAILVLGAGVYIQRGDIALRILPKASEIQFASDKIASFGDGLHIALCGAGGPMPAHNRSGPCVAVVAAGKLFLVDAGANGLRNLGRMGYQAGSISGVFLTHFHSDHIDGLGEVATIRWAAGGHSAPLNVYGPEGVAQVVDGFNQVYGQDKIYRNDHHGDTVTPLSGAGMIPVSAPIPIDGQLVTVYQQDGLKVEMLVVDHFPISPAVAYRFSYKGRTALISGATNKSANIEKFAQGIDLLVHEALSPAMLKAMNQGATAAGLPNTAKIFHDVLDYHTTPTQAAEIARDANVGHLLYYHVVPPLIMPGSEAIWLSGVDERFSDYTLGEDGTSVSLPVNSTDIIVSESSL